MIYLWRIRTSDQGTLGLLSTGQKTLELPWRNNKRSISCIPEGEYQCTIYHSRKYKTVYHIQDVPGRTAILMHSGNYAGSSAAGLKTHSRGCILIGKRFGTLDGQRAILSSRIGLREFMEMMDNRPFTLRIENVYY